MTSLHRVAPHFVGRTAEMELLKTAWREIDGDNPGPRVINVIADTGVGKTRLVQAFYEWLSTDSEDTAESGNQSYWPDNLGDGRQRISNPNLDHFPEFDLKNQNIPWLWWGMHWTDQPNEITNALNRFADYLDLHLTMLELQHKCNQGVKDVFLDFFKDEAIERAADYMLESSFIIKIGKTAYQAYKSNRKLKEDAKKGIRIQSREQCDELADELINRLSRMFNPDTSRIPRVPVVMFLDDIHFAASVNPDEFTLQFIDRLLRQAAREKWPLLVITTHWKAEWQSHLANDALAVAKPWRRIVAGLEAAPQLSTLRFIELELSNVPRGDLGRIVSELLPGLDELDQREILDRIDNVRWLTEVLNALRIEHFEGGKRNSSLNSAGRDFLKNDLLKTRGYLDVIRVRLQDDSMFIIRNVLGVTAWNTDGLEFVSDLARAFGEQMRIQKLLPEDAIDPGEQVLNVLVSALDPHALLDGELEDRNLPGLVRFPERGYWEVAREMCSQSYLPAIRLALGEEIIEWMKWDHSRSAKWLQLSNLDERKAFLEIAVLVLERLQPRLSAQQIAKLEAEEETLRRMVQKGRMTEDELQSDLIELRRSLLSASGEAGLQGSEIWLSVAKAELANILYEEGHARALEFAIELAKLAYIDDSRKLTSEQSQTTLYSLWCKSKDCWDVMRTCLSADIQRAESLGDLVRGSHLIGHKADLDRDAGDTAQARAGYEQSLSILQRLVDDDSHATERLRDMSISLMRLGDLDRDAGDITRARARYGQCLAIRQRLIDDYSETPERLRDLTVSMERLADLDRDAGDIAQAREGYEQTLVISQRLIDDYGDTPDRLRDMTFSLGRIADFHHAVGHTSQARAGYEQCLAIRKRLIDDYGDSPERLQNLSFSLNRLADLDRDAGDTVRARDRFKLSLALLQRLIDNYGETPERLRELTVSFVRLADLDFATGDTTQAREGFVQSLEIRKRLINDYGENPKRLRDLSLVLERLADLDHAAGDTAQAFAGYVQSLAICQQLIDSYGNSPERLQDVALALERLADLDHDAGHTAQARARNSQCLSIRQRLIDDYGPNPERLQALAYSLARLADLDFAAGDTGKARAGYAQCLAIRKQLVDDYGDTPGQLRELTVSIMRLADLDFAGGDISRARAGFAQSLGIRKRLINDYGETSARLLDLAYANWRLTYLDLSKGNRVEVLAGYTQQLAIAQRFIDDFSVTPAVQKSLFISLMSLADVHRAEGNIAEARAGYAQCLTICQRLIGEYGEAPERMQDLFLVLKHLAELDSSAGNIA